MKIFGSFQGDFEIFLKMWYKCNFIPIYCSFPGVSLMMREWWGEAREGGGGITLAMVLTFFTVPPVVLYCMHNRAGNVFRHRCTGNYHV